MFNLLTRLFGNSTDDLITRVNRYRGQGFSEGGRNTAFSYKVDDLDYQLMGADNSCARIAFGEEQSRSGAWFAIDPHSKLAQKPFGNSEGTSYDGGKTFITESAYLAVPKPECRVSPEEVVWHHLRVVALKAAGIDQPERMRLMTEERQSKPWLATVDKVA